MAPEHPGRSGASSSRRRSAGCSSSWIGARLFLLLVAAAGSVDAQDAPRQLGSGGATPSINGTTAILGPEQLGSYIVQIVQAPLLASLPGAERRARRAEVPGSHAHRHRHRRWCGARVAASPLSGAEACGPCGDCDEPLE